MKSDNKKISFIYPSCYNEKGQIVKIKPSWIPPRTLSYLAALTPQQFETRIIDERVEDLYFSEGDDLIALTGMLNHIPRAIDIAKEYKKNGKKVIIGGPGVYALQHEIEKMDIFDSIVIGEAETLWNTILEDFDRGNLKRIYQSQPLKELKGLPFARFDLLKSENYRKAVTDPKNFTIPIETSRGCPHACKFCSVTQYFGKTIRYRPISEVINEIKYQRGNYILFTDDNIAVNHNRARELFLALKPLGIHWFGQFDTTVINHPEIIKLAGESGCRTAFIGIESLDKDNLISIQKKHNVDVQVKELIQHFKKANINVMCSVIFGMDYDSPESIRETVTFMIDNKVEMMVPWILTPIPRTPLHEEFKSKNLLLHDNYSLYDCVHCVFRPKQMKHDELEEVYWHSYRHFYDLKAIFPRSLKSRSLRTNAQVFFRELYFKNKVYHRKHPFSS